MSKKNVLILLLGIFTIPVIMKFWILKNEVSYEEQIKEYRLERDFFMRNSESSPFSEKNDFSKLQYYPVSEKYKVKANFKQSSNINTITVATSDNKQRRYREYGTATFLLEGKTFSLKIYQSAEFGGGGEPLFLGFTDITTGSGTYGAGRYLDVIHNGESTIVLDFNKAYNPFCAYNDNYSCPIPPVANSLDIALKAGEKDYKK